MGCEHNEGGGFNHPRQPRQSRFIVQQGFARVRSPDCAHEFFVAYSCPMARLCLCPRWPPNRFSNCGNRKSSSSCWPRGRSPRKSWPTSAVGSTPASARIRASAWRPERRSPCPSTMRNSSTAAQRSRRTRFQVRARSSTLEVAPQGRWMTELGSTDS